VAALLGSTAFDSFTNTTWWIQTVQNSTTPATLWGTGGLLTMITIVFVTFSLAAAWMGRYGNHPATAYPRLMAGSLLPIVLGYVVAHYATLLIVEGQGRDQLLRPARSRLERLRISRDGRELRNLQPSNSDRRNAGLRHRRRPRVRHHLCTRKRSRSCHRTVGCAASWPLLLVMIGYTCAGLLLLFSP
jgi:hypothetical protein